MSEHDSSETDRLLARLEQGDRECLGRLLALHREYVKRVVELRMGEDLRGRVDPSDVVQETQLVVTRRIDDFLQRRPGHAISVWDLESRRLVDSFGSTDPPWRLVESSADGRYLAAARIGQIALFDLDSHRMIETWSIDDRLDPHRLAVSHSGRLAAGHQNDLRLFELHADREPRVLEGHSSTLSGSAFHPTGQLLAMVGHDRILKVYRVATGELLYSIVAHRDWVRSVAFSPDGKTIATAANNDQVRLWHTATGQPLGSLLPEARSMKKLVFDPAGLRLIGFPSYQLAQTVVYDASVLPSAPDPNSRGSRVPRTASDRSGLVSH